MNDFSYIIKMKGKQNSEVIFSKLVTLFIELQKKCTIGVNHCIYLNKKKL